MVLAISSERPIEPIGISAAISLRPSSPARMDMAWVRIYPGSTPLTVMFSRANSNAAVRMKPFKPPFDAA